MAPTGTTQKSGLSFKKALLFFFLILVLLTFAYIFLPSFLRDIIVWVVFILLILFAAFIGFYLIRKYKTENKGRLERLMENISAGIVGAVLVTLLDKLSIYSIGIFSLSLDTIFQFLVGLAYVVALVIFTLGICLVPIWALLSYVDKED